MGNSFQKSVKVKVDENNVKVKISNWHGGKYESKVEIFESLEKAKEKIKKEEGKIKIYDKDDHLIHSNEQHKHDLYC